MPPRQITRILRRAAANYTSVVLSPVNDDAPAANLLADTVYVDRPEHVEITVQRLRRAIGFVPGSIYRGMAPAAALKPGTLSCLTLDLLVGAGLRNDASKRASC